MNYFLKIFVFVAIVSHQICADPVVRDPIYETVDFLTLHDRENTEEILSLSQTQQFVEVVWERTGHCDHAVDACENCLHSEDLFDIVGANTTLGLEQHQFEQVSAVLLYYLEVEECRLPEETIANMTYADYLDALFMVPGDPHDHGHVEAPGVEAHDHFTEGQLSHILHTIGHHYTSASENKCFSEHSVFHDCGLEDGDHVHGAELEMISSVVLTNLLHGECIGSSKIVNPDSFVEEVFELYGHDGMISDHDFIHVMVDLGLYTDEEHDHLSEPASKRKRSISILEGDHDHDNHSHCYTPDELVHAFDVHDGITYSSFLDMCPSLVQMLVTDACHEEHVDPEPVEASSIVYLYATLAVFAVTLASISGIVIFPFMSTKIYERVMHFCTALAVSTLSGDALLHLLPEALGLHSHSSDEHDDHAHEAATEPEFVLGKIMTVVGAIYVFFLFEKGLEIVFGKGGHQHGHSHDDINQVMKGEENQVDVLENEVHEKTNGVNHAPNGNTKSYGTSTAEKQTNGGVTLDIDHGDEEKDQKFSLLRGMSTISAMVLMGDVLHNFMDGIAIGVAFTLDYFVGISTCLAIFCHEFPHEIGDFVIFTKNGMTKTTAFIWIILSNVCGLGGVYAGIALGSNESIHQWIFAITTGFFLYVSLVDLMPEMLRDPNSKKPSVFLLNNIGLLLGWFLLTILAYFEEDIYNLF